MRQNEGLLARSLLSCTRRQGRGNPQRQVYELQFSNKVLACKRMFYSVALQCRRFPCVVITLASKSGQGGGGGFLPRTPVGLPLSWIWIRDWANMLDQNVSALHAMMSGSITNFYQAIWEKCWQKNVFSWSLAFLN